MKEYLVAFPGGDCTTVKADGFSITESGALWFYNYGTRNIFGPPSRLEFVKAISVWFWVEEE